MKNFCKDRKNGKGKQKGITLTALAIAIVVLIILAFTVAVNLSPLRNEKIRTNFEKDIKQLREKVDEYYSRNYTLPVINRYTDESGIASIQSVKNVNDNDEYYVLDISKLNIELNYGKDYEVAAATRITEEIKDLSDIYIINAQSHTVYYPKGVEFDDTEHYKEDIVYSEIKYDKGDQIAPVIDSITISNITTKSFTVNADVIDIGSGLDKVIFYCKKSNSSVYETITKQITGGENGGSEAVVTQNYENISNGIYEVYVEVFDKEGNKTRSEIKTVTLGSIPKATGAQASTTEWTNQNVTVTLPTNETFITQYQIGGTDGEWQTYNGTPLVIDSNTAIYYRYSDGTNTVKDEDISNALRTSALLF